ncbi:MAG TPA: DinB family protein [Bryobacteraceae bacterium]|nr:DinB family protein [Bryobacteraceae bacterium]
MDTAWKDALWGQFGAAIDTLNKATTACPEELWGDRARRPEFWRLVYHTLFFLDLYLSGSLEGFQPPVPFTLNELDRSGVRPDRVYTKDELRAYIDHCRRKCHETISALTDEKARQRCEYRWVQLPFGEFLLYNMRHVQHHAAQLNLILRQSIDSAPRWVFRAEP